MHVVGWGVLGDTWPFFRPNFVAMQRAGEELGVAGEVVGFCPTGWVYEMRRNAFPVRTRGSLSVHLVPYSEHSSYSELREYVKWLKPKQVCRFRDESSSEGQCAVCNNLERCSLSKDCPLSTP